MIHEQSNLAKRKTRVKSTTVYAESLYAENFFITEIYSQSIWNNVKLKKNKVTN